MMKKKKKYDIDNLLKEVENVKKDILKMLTYTSP